MVTQRRRTPLEEIPLFAGMTPEQRRDMEAAGSRRRVARGRLLFREGDRPAGLHVLLSGRLRSFRRLPGGGEILMHFVQPGEMFGEVPLMLGGSYPASAEAVEEAEVFTLPLPALKKLMASDPEIGLLFMRNMAKKLAMLLERIELQKAGPAERRVARALLRGAEGKPVAAGRVFVVPGTKRLWAQDLGTQPERLSRALQQFRNEGLIEVRGREITIKNPEGLAAWAVPEVGAEADNQ